MAINSPFSRSRSVYTAPKATDDVASVCCVPGNGLCWIGRNNCTRNMLWWYVLSYLCLFDVVVVSLVITVGCCLMVGCCLSLDVGVGIVVVATSQLLSLLLSLLLVVVVVGCWVVVDDVTCFFPRVKGVVQWYTGVGFRFAVLVSMHH